jgi:hypothetical protein
MCNIPIFVPDKIKRGGGGGMNHKRETDRQEYVEEQLDRDYLLQLNIF